MLISSVSKVQQDNRWHGVALVYFRLFFAKNIFLVVLACLFISESIIFRKSWTEAGYGVDEDYSPYAPWLRICMALVPDSAFIIATLILCATRRFHPITALVAAIVLFGLYVNTATFNSIVVLSAEVYFGARDTWSKICYAETGVQVVIAFLHLAMVVYAGKAVHRWRKARGEALSGTEEFGLEAANGKAAEARRFS